MGSSMLVYASIDDLTNWLGVDAPSNASNLLRSASILVANACQTDLYGTLPDAGTLAVLNDATCAQAALWVALGVDPATGGLSTSVVKASKIGTASITYDALDAATVMESLTCLAPEALAILTAANVIFEPVPLSDESQYLLHYGLEDPCGIGVSIGPPYTIVELGQIIQGEL